jgi:hypothetical protein
VRQQVKRLKYEPDALAPQQRAHGVVCRRHHDAVERDAACIRLVESRYQVEQGGLADAGLPDDRDVFAARQFQGDSAQHLARPRAAVGFA